MSAAWLTEKIAWWKNQRFFLYDFAEIWTDDRRDYLLLWSRDIAVGFFVSILITAGIALWAPHSLGMPEGQEPDTIMMVIQHNNEMQMSLINSRLDRHDEQIAVLRSEVSGLMTSMEESIWYRRWVIGLLGALIVGVAGLFAKIRMGGNRR